LQTYEKILKQKNFFERNGSKPVHHPEIRVFLTMMTMILMILPDCRHTRNH